MIAVNPFPITKTTKLLKNQHTIHHHKVAELNYQLDIAELLQIAPPLMSRQIQVSFAETLVEDHMDEHRKLQARL